MEAEAGLLTLIGVEAAARPVSPSMWLSSSMPSQTSLAGGVPPLSDPALVDQAVAAVLQVREGRADPPR